MLKQNLKNILRLAYICIFLFILGFITLLPSTSSPTLAQSPWTTYEDNDPLVLAGYSEGDWQTVSIAEAVGGNLTWTDVPGAELVLYFEGSAIEILYSRGPEGGDFSIHLDGLSWPPFNGYAEQYLYGTSIQQFGISPGVHQLVMTNGDGALWIEAIRIQGTLVQTELELSQDPHPEPTFFVQEAPEFTQDFEDNTYGPDEARPVVTGSPYVMTGYYGNIHPFIEVPDNQTRVAVAYAYNTAPGTTINLQVDLTLGAAPGDLQTVSHLDFYWQSGILRVYGGPPFVFDDTIRVILLDANNVTLYSSICTTTCGFTPFITQPVSNVRTIRLQFTGVAAYSYLVYFVSFDNIVIEADPDPCTGKPNVDPQTVAALWAYGVQVLCDGDKDWENEELETLLEGVEETANALHQFNQTGSYITAIADAQNLFKHLMGSLKVVRLSNDTQRQLGECVGTQDTACTFNEGDTLAFYGNVASRPTGFSKQLVVHELGHRFDYRADTVTGESLEARVQGPSNARTELRDCRYDNQGIKVEGELVMGPIGGGRWERGGRGWGTSGTEVTLFQQNPENSFNETAADMSLNWVYRRLVDGTDTTLITDPCQGPTTPPANTGFQNIDDDGDTDNSLPGNIRYWWTENTMRNIFSHEEWG